MLLIEPVAIFEFAVPAEVFGIDRSDDGVPSFDFRVCAADPGRPLRAHVTTPVSITPGSGLDALDDADLIAIPASPVRDYDERVLDSLRRNHERGALLLSVCSGVFALAAAGILDGRRCTAHWHSLDELQASCPEARVEPDLLFVDEGSVITSAGTAAGIDACLHIVRRELGSDVANRIARRMVVPPQRDGGQQQYVPLPVPTRQVDGFAGLLDHLSEHLGEQHSTSSMARRVMMSERTFARKFVAEVGVTPHQWLIRQRVLRARMLLEEGNEPVEAVAASVGFSSAVVLRDHFRRELGIAPSTYRRRFSIA